MFTNSLLYLTALGISEVCSKAKYYTTYYRGSIISTMLKLKDIEK